MTPSPPDQPLPIMPTSLHWYVGMNITIKIDDIIYEAVTAQIKDFFVSTLGDIEIQISVLQKSVASRRLLALFEYILYIQIGNEGQSEEVAEQLQSQIITTIQNATFWRNLNVTNFTDVVIFPLSVSGILATPNPDTEVRNTSKTFSTIIIVGAVSGIVCCLCCCVDFPGTTQADTYTSDDDDDFEYEEEHMDGTGYVVGRLYPSISFLTNSQTNDSMLYMPQTIYLGKLC
jgi:hypothetical protein